MSEPRAPFFTPLETEPAPMPRWDPFSQPEWLRVPWEIAPSVVDVAAVVARSGRFAVAIGPLTVYDRGLLLELTLIRNPWGDAADDELMSAQHGPLGRGDGGFRAGLRWSDGSVARTDARHHHGPQPPASSMVSRGGGGSNDASSSVWWVWPLPTAGDLELVLEFPSGGIPEQSTMLAGEPIRAAAARAQPIWEAPS